MKKVKFGLLIFLLIGCINVVSYDILADEYHNDEKPNSTNVKGQSDDNFGEDTNGLAPDEKPPINNIVGDEVKDTDIPDKKLYDMLLKVLGKQPGEKLYVSELRTIPTLDLSNSGIINLTGIEKCEGLTTLILNNNGLTDLSPVASLTKLEILSFADNHVSDFRFLNNLTNLKQLTINVQNIQASEDYHTINGIYHIPPVYAMDGSKLIPTTITNEGKYLENVPDNNEDDQIVWELSNFDGLNVSYSYIGNILIQGNPVEYKIEISVPVIKDGAPIISTPNDINDSQESVNNSNTLITSDKKVPSLLNSGGELKDFAAPINLGAMINHLQKNGMVKPADLSESIANLDLVFNSLNSALNVRDPLRAIRKSSLIKTGDETPLNFLKIGNISSLFIIITLLFNKKLLMK